MWSLAQLRSAPGCPHLEPHEEGAPKAAGGCSKLRSPFEFFRVLHAVGPPFPEQLQKRDLTEEVSLFGRTRLGLFLGRGAPARRRRRGGGPGFCRSKANSKGLLRKTWCMNTETPVWMYRDSFLHFRTGKTTTALCTFPREVPERKSAGNDSNLSRVLRAECATKLYKRRNDRGTHIISYLL